VSYVIESGIEIPPPLRPPGTRSRPRSPIALTLEKMDVLQSVLLDSARDYDMARGTFPTLRPKRFITRKTRAGWRVWRVQ
jgi:hypothetical protein